jgi:hypothetical protein
MENNLSKQRIAWWLAPAAALGLAASSGPSGAGYLPKTGPTPLRFQVVPEFNAFVLPPLAMEESNGPVLTNMPPPQDTSQAVHYSAASKEVPPPMPLWPAPMWVNPYPGFYSPEPPGPANPEPEVPGNSKPVNRPTNPVTNPVTNASPGTGAAGDVLKITPDMLVDYFKPARVPTNAPGAAATIPMGFVPALPSTPIARPTDATP